MAISALDGLTPTHLFVGPEMTDPQRAFLEQAVKEPDSELNRIINNPGSSANDFSAANDKLRSYLQDSGASDCSISLGTGPPETPTSGDAEVNRALLLF